MAENLSGINNNSTQNNPHIDTSIPWAATIKSPTKGDILLSGTELSTDTLEISSSVYNIFAWGKWIHINNPLLVENGDIAVGTILQFDFLPNNSPARSFQFAVLGIEINSLLTAKYPGNAFTLYLVSPWYFKQYSYSRAYMGKTSDIVNQVLYNDYGLGDLAFNKITLTPTGEYTNDIRYRTEMTQSGFFEQRLKPHLKSTIQGNSIFMYTNASNEFEIMDYPTMVTSGDQYTAIDLSHPQMSAYQSQLQDYYKAQYLIFPMNETFQVNTKGKRDLWMMVNPALIYMYHQNAEVKNSDADPVLPFLGYDIPSGFSFIRKEAVPTLTTKTFLEDSMHDYEDIFSEVVNKYNKSLTENQGDYMVCYPNINVDVGRLCDRYLTYTDDQTRSAFSQKYIITEVSHTFSGPKGLSFITLGTTAFILPPTGVTGLYSAS